MHWCESCEKRCCMTGNCEEFKWGSDAYLCSECYVEDEESEDESEQEDFEDEDGENGEVEVSGAILSEAQSRAVSYHHLTTAIPQIVFDEARID
jgi:hypothetical protein